MGRRFGLSNANEPGSKPSVSTATTLMLVDGYDERSTGSEAHYSKPPRRALHHPARHPVGSPGRSRFPSVQRRPRCAPPSTRCWRYVSSAYLGRRSTTGGDPALLDPDPAGALILVVSLLWSVALAVRAGRAAGSSLSAPAQNLRRRPAGWVGGTGRRRSHPTRAYRYLDRARRGCGGIREVLALDRARRGDRARPLRAGGRTGLGEECRPLDRTGLTTDPDNQTSKYGHGTRTATHAAPARHGDQLSVAVGVGATLDVAAGTLTA